MALAIKLKIKMKTLNYILNLVADIELDAVALMQELWAMVVVAEDDYPIGSSDIMLG